MLSFVSRTSHCSGHCQPPPSCANQHMRRTSSCKRGASGIPEFLKHTTGAHCNCILNHKTMHGRSRTGCRVSCFLRTASQPKVTSIRLQRVIPRAGTEVSELLDVYGSIGIVAATLSFLLLTLEKGESQSLRADLERAKEELQKVNADLKGVKSQLAAVEQNQSDLELYKRRYKESEKELFKLEKALELKDGQLESFMNLAQRQIKMLEGRIKDLQKVK